MHAAILPPCRKAGNGYESFKKIQFFHNERFEWHVSRSFSSVGFLRTSGQHARRAGVMRFGQQIEHVTGATQDPGRHDIDVGSVVEATFCLQVGPGIGGVILVRTLDARVPSGAFF
jgi:hypothetical protein